MDKLDIIFIPLDYFLLLTLTLLRLVAHISGHYYDYWFHLHDNVKLRRDIIICILYISLQAGMNILYAFHTFTKFIVSFAQVLPLSNIILWWTKLYWGIIRDHKGRSLWQVLSNPRFRGRVKHIFAHISCNTKRQFIAKVKTKIRPTWYRLGG